MKKFDQYRRYCVESDIDLQDDDDNDDDNDDNDDDDDDIIVIGCWEIMQFLTPLFYIDFNTGHGRIAQDWNCRGVTA